MAIASLALAASASGAGLASHVHVFAGTRPGPGTFGGGHNFPGAAVPFGMVQWSPDTTPADRNGRGGYDHRDNHIRGFGLTHLAGAGCSLYGDFPFLPTTKRLLASPAGRGSSLDGDLQPGFSHARESGSPGRYAVRLNPVSGGGIEVALTATARTGMARFAFPRSRHASVLIDAGGSTQPNDFASVAVDPARREIDGTASSGLFCGQRPRYRVYIAAVFDRGFDAYGAWERNELLPGATVATADAKPASNPAATAGAGAYASFDTRRDRVVTARVGVSFVSVAGARANLAAENPGLRFATVARRAKRTWNRSLAKIRVRGGPDRRRDMLYTALYHALLAPRTFSDADGAYIGMDGLVHRARRRIQYADLSGWDTYRTQIQLLAILMPRRASDVVRSLLADASESGCLPRWPYANGQSMTMVGDSADPLIASAAAFGARGFDRRAALAAMLRGADAPCRSANGEYLERQGLERYLALGYVPYDLDTHVRNANSIYGSPDAVWGSAATSLEYAVDDFSIAQFAARALRDRRTYRRFMRRSGGWRKLFDPRSGRLEPRYEDGRFPARYDGLGGAGFVEGDSAQYTWMVPHDPSGLFRRMGGRPRAAARLRRFLRRLNGSAGGTHTDHALLGNEPTLHTPWLFDWAGQPYRTQDAVRRGLGLFDTAPAGYPGNDDLGTLSSWYVFGALGLYPEVPGVGVLAIGSPLFPHATISLPHGRRLTIDASPGRYVQGVRLDGRGYGRPWIAYCDLAAGARLRFRLGRRPNRGWGAAAAAAPPSFGPRHRAPSGFCRP